MSGLQQGARRKILFVDDHDSYRATVAEMLKRRGFDTTEAKNGEAALAILEQTGCIFDLVLTDVVMPGMNGVALASRVQSLHEGLKTLLISGYPPATLEGKFGMSTDLLPFFLSKPFTIEALCAKIAEITGRGETV